MPEIMLLNQETIDKIAAGEVVERPSSVVKELVENAIDAKATAVTVEIKEGGISFIRITDNGCGIEKKQVPIAFLRHSTSKIRSVEDLLSIHSLGFRGEALSSIAAVAQVELITKTYEELTGTRYVIEGSKEIENEEIGAPEGTTFIVRNLFYNVPARRKFLKTAQTEAGYISDLMERMALSHPDVSFKFINNGQTKLHTSGNGNEKDLIYHIYGRDITAAVLKVEHETELFKLRGFIGKPIISRGNRNYENYFINGRYIKSALIAKSIEEAYKGFMMQHQYPFCVLYFEMNSELLDVNVHPTKMELRFSQNEEIYRSLFEIIRNTISHRDFIPEVPVTEEKKEMIPPVPKHTPEPFEIRRRGQDAFFEKMKQTSASPLTVQEENLFAKPLVAEAETNTSKEPIAEINSEQPTLENNFKEIVSEIHDIESTPQETAPIYEQQNLEQLDSHFLTKGFMMQHQYPFCVLYFEMNSELLDVNVHPTKMELRFSQNEEIYRSLFEIIRNTISHRDFIPEVPVTEEKKEMIPPVPKHTPEPFEIRRRGQDAFFEKMKQTSASPLTVQEENLFAKPLVAEAETNTSKEPIAEINSEQPTLENNFKEIVSEIHDIESTPQETAPIYEQQNLEQLDSHFLTKDARKKHKIIGQLFDTYWLIEYEDKLFIIDQHAAHEKVLYERTMKKISEKTFTSQTISPPIILTLNQDEVQALETYEAQLSMFGYEIEPFGGKEYAITAIPADFTDIDMKTMFIEMLDDFANISGKDAPNLIMEKVASMSCKAAVKGNNHLSRPEIEALIDELLELDNPYNCPHGRPTIISMTKYEIEKKFRRIV